HRLLSRRAATTVGQLGASQFLGNVAPRRGVRMVRPALAVVFSLLLAALARAQQPQLGFSVQPGGVVAATLPISILQDASVRKQLRSGLTTTFLFVTRQRDTKVVSGARIEIRYDL